MIHKDYLTLVGKNISALRHMRCEKLSCVSVNTGISMRVLSQIENGKYPSVKLITLKKLGDYFDAQLDELLVSKERTITLELTNVS